MTLGLMAAQKSAFESCMNVHFLAKSRLPVLCIDQWTTVFESDNHGDTAAWRLLIPRLDHPADEEAFGLAPNDISPMERVVATWTERDSLNTKSLRKGHAILMHGEPGAGEFRRNGVCQVRCRHTGAAVYTPPPADKVAALVDDLFAFVATNPAPTLVKAFVALLPLLLIHPFKDGNGRCARGLFAAICARGVYQHPVVLLALQRLYGGSATRLHAGSAVLRATGDWRDYLAYCSQSLDEAIRDWSANQSTKTLHDRNHTSVLASR